MVPDIIPSIFDYATVSDFLMAVHESFRSKNQRYSVRSWAKRLKIKSPASLFRVLKGERRITTELIVAISDSLEFNDVQRAYFELIAYGDDKISTPSLNLIRSALSGLSNDSGHGDSEVSSVDTDIHLSALAQTKEVEE